MNKALLQKWFVRLYIPALMLVIFAGMIFVLKFGYKPVPPMVMTPSFFDQPGEIGAVVFRRFYAEIKEGDLMVFGTPLAPEFHQDILKGFLQAAQTDGVHFDTVIAEQQMPTPEVPAGTVIVKVPTNTDSEAEVLDAIVKASGAGKHTLVYLPSVFSTHVLKGNTISRIEKELKRKIFAITTAALSLANDQEYLVDPTCVGSERDNQGTSDFGCAILAAGRPFYKEMMKKNHSPSEMAKAHPETQARWAAIMNQPTQDQDYLLMVSYPGQDHGNAVPNRQLRMNPPGGAGGPTR